MEPLIVQLISVAVQTAIILAGGFIALGSMKAEVRTQGERLARVDEELSQLRQVVVQIARQEERMNAMDQRMLSQGRRIDRMKDGPSQRFEE